MVSKKQPDFLPPGWKEQTKVKNGRKYKYYINAKNKQKFYSKPAVLRYLKDGCISNEKVQHIEECTKKTSAKNQMQLSQANDYEWLPTGWVIERRFRKSGSRAGMEYKCFINPSTGSKFFSKPEVLRHLGSKQRTGLSRGKAKERSGHSSSERSVDLQNDDKSKLEAKVSQISKTLICKNRSSGKLKVVVEKTVDEELPSGWIKETRIKMLGNKIVRRDPFFVDPASPLVFRSKLEVLRYLETGAISRHAYRRSGKITGEDLAITKSPGNKEDTSKSRTRKQLFEAEGSSGRNLEPPSKAEGHEKSGDTKRKASLRVRPALANPEKGTLSPESASDSQEKVEVMKPVGMEKHALPAVKDVDAKEAFLGKIESSSVPSREVIAEENPLAVVLHDCNDNKVLTTKRKIKDEKSPCVPLRSSKRLAGVDANVVFLSIPIEHALRTTNKKPSKPRSIPSLEVPTDKQEKDENVDGKNLNECAVKITSRRKPSSSFKLTPKALNEKQQDADEESSLATLGEAPLNRVNVSKFQVNNRIVDGDEKVVFGIQVEQPMNKNDCNLTSFEEQCLSHDPEGLETVPASQVEPFCKIDDLPSQEVMHHGTLDVDTKTVVATQGEPSSKIDDLKTTKPILVDLNDLQLEAPPGFSDNAKVGASTISVKQSLEHPMSALLGSQVENTSKGRPTLEEQSMEQPANTEKQIEQPQSELSFTAHLWSDPCLEFAYKTLTGAIPFDDNLAIQDYLQHQLRTSEPVPDICTPSFFRNDESKLVSQLPEDVNFLKSNSFGSTRNQAGKNK